ncbi:hypothetical protein MNBD_NITROSPINAE04-2118 [hydrothermal vent metagenome]|uniref:Uncharacterized protein n=1 Tax=hydrothermal vent metagenome TaxID=652676 RepID=A0A3B1D3V0_9ZZZZ
MSLGLTNSKFAMGQPPQRMGLVSRKYKVTTSIAEGAVFIPKPRKRVTFEMNLPGSGPTEVNRRRYDPIPLPGAGKVGKTNVVDSMTRGELGANGVTKRFDSSAYTGAPQGYVKMSIDYTPDKQSDVIVTQEEGRQVNNAAIHFTQQYDSYGRPRIGFSREPYDFAATKFVSVTNQIAFQQNTSQTRESFNEYLLNGSGSEDAEPQVLGQDGPKSNEAPIFGSSYADAFNPGVKVGAEDYFLGPKPGNVGFKEVSAEESFKAQQVEKIDTLGDNSSSVDKSEKYFGAGSFGKGNSVVLPGSGGGGEPMPGLFDGEIDTGEVKTLDVSA